jgi:hypothetical protein
MIKSRNLPKSLLAFTCLAAIFIVFSAIVGGNKVNPALAQQPATVILQASIGFEDKVKPETWVPVLVHLENAGPGVQGYVQVNYTDIDDKSVYRLQVDLPSGAKKELVVYVFVPSYAYEAEVSFYSGQQRQATQKLQINLQTVNDRLVGIAAETASSFNLLNLVDPPNGDSSTAEIQLQKLPDFGLALESLDAILISDVDSGELSKSQVQALTAWVTGGGRLMLFGGPDWEKTTAAFSSSELMPISPTGTELVNDWNSFSSIASTQSEISGQAVAVTGNLMTGAQVLASTEDGMPLIVQRNLGAGEVIFFTVDPTLAPLNGWPGMEGIYRYLFNRSISAPPWQHGINDWYSAANAAQTLPNLSFPPALLVCGFLVMYVLILGPINYLVVRKLKRRELGWITTPVLIIIFSLVVLVSGGLSRSRQPILNRLSIVQVWPGAPLARLDGIIGTYSPFRSTYQLDFEANVLAHNLPANQPPINRGAVIYQNATGGFIPGLRVEVGSIQPVTMEGLIPAPKFEGSLKISIDDTGAAMIGNVKNNSDLSLENAVLVTSGGVVDLGTFSPGETREVHQALNRSLTLQPSLTGIYPAKPVYSPAVPLPYPGSYSNNTYAIENIVGTSDFYSNREIYRKYSLVSSIFYNSTAPTSMGNEIYLSGWSKQPILPANLHEVKSEIQDTNLILVRFDPTIETNSKEIKIAPEFFSWTPLDTQSASFSPYQLYFYGTETYGFKYKPTLEVDFSNVSQLILNLEGSGKSGPIIELDVYLWDVQLADWEKIPGINWGDNPIGDPQRFVQADGTIQMQLRGTGQYVDITRADFTLFALTVAK